jgi:hypothetical protein
VLLHSIRQEGPSARASGMPTAGKLVFGGLEALNVDVARHRTKGRLLDKIYREPPFSGTDQLGRRLAFVLTPEAITREPLSPAMMRL